MKNKIGQFLWSMLILCAVLILAANGSSRSRGGADAPVQTTAAVEETNQPTETAAPPEQTVQTEPRSDAAPADAMGTVTRILAEHRLDETAVSHCIYDPELNDTEAGTEGAGDRACAFALAQLCAERKMNPVAAFWMLESEGLYEKERDGSAKLSLPGYGASEREAQRYDDSAEGAARLAGDLLDLCSRMEDGLGMETQFLGENGEVEGDQVFYSAKEDCYYGYFVCYGERSAHFLCLYLRGDEAGTYISDAEFQLLNLHYASGDAGAEEEMAYRAELQTASLMTSMELLLTGQTRLDGAPVPFSYTLGDHSVTVERFYFTGSGENGSLINYRIRTGA